MNAGRCCAGMRITQVDPHPHSFKRRLIDRGAKILPAFILVILPKCPACLAAYITVATGIGVSLGAAAYLRSFLLVVCVLTLAYFAMKMIRQLRVRLRTFNSESGRSKDLSQICRDPGNPLHRLFAQERRKLSLWP